MIVEVQQPKMAISVLTRGLCVPEACDDRIELIPMDGSATVNLEEKVAILLAS